jgi:antibiotic biosynthesis monooxygenase (ABM) superfamily enzyme
MNVHYPMKTFSTGSALTILVHRSVSREEEQRFLEVLQSLLGEFNRISGTLGSHVFRRELGDQVEFSILQGFSDESVHQAWRKSPGFERWLREVAPEKPTPGHLRRYSGMEALFVSAKTPGAPLRWKMALLMLAAVFPFSLAINLWFAPVLARMSAVIGSLVTSIVMVLLMTYVIVPILTWLFAGWLKTKD